MAKSRKTATAPRRKTQPRTRHLTFLLLRKGIREPEAALKTPGALLKKPLSDGFEFEGVLYICEPDPREPRWLSFVKEGFPDGLSLTPSAAPSAVLFIKTDSRLFALTFGQGRQLLKPDAYEVDFGLKTTLNTVDEKKLRSLDSRTFEDMTVHTRRQVSRSSSLDAFSVDVFRDLLGAVTGEPADTSLAKRLTGRDALALTGAVAFSDLATHCKALLKAYQSTRYQEKFSWVDNIRLERDTVVVDALNARLLQALNRGDLHRIHLAPPEVLPWDDVAGFLYPGERRNGEPHTDLDIQDCLVVLAARQGVNLDELDLSLEELERNRIRAVFEESSIELEKWSLYNCLVAEMESTEALHVLSAGQWFRIEKTFAAQTRRDAATFARESRTLPTARAGEEEEDYNKRAAATVGTLALLDRNLIKSKGAHTPIEACDLFSPHGQFIHVKRKVRSSALSHLFSQGAVAAETFLRDADFREALKQLVEAQNSSLAKLLGNPLEKPEPSKYEIVFAVITDSAKDWPQALPFFSQLNLVRNAQRLGMFGFRVALWKVEERP